MSPVAPPSPFVATHLDLIRRGGHVLDLACGNGRNTRLLLEHGFRVTAVDINMEGIRDLEGHSQLTSLALDMETPGDPWPISRHVTTPLDGIVVTNYLHRPQFPYIATSLKPSGGLLIYETFMAGNEQYGKPSNPRFLLQQDELTEAFADLSILAFEQGYREAPSPAIVQSLCARAS
ncbi:MAG: SAM-dependent methyltransferase [Gammaproteobacteria bacterium]|uniref:SAM-dependent methyltransferase n=1 Tax=OM182 bacterium MED-G24 TaxID=1986255 RepID=A0A2A5WHK1_9GAMM|nr:SAM-dependent methyltransferase [Gammaproteobacteria bacterium]PDH35949.1 MAG: SAM-dependent methyltransferase [OM182 bacterium MED-G24]RPG23475.1 MAG: methyltransferase domain-containing protein [Gammaproteobacteria bacterium TMED50]